jgi:hypothetical protein
MFSDAVYGGKEQARKARENIARAKLWAIFRRGQLSPLPRTPMQAKPAAKKSRRKASAKKKH